MADRAGRTAAGRLEDRFVLGAALLAALAALAGAPSAPAAAAGARAIAAPAASSPPAATAATAAARTAEAAAAATAGAEAAGAGEARLSRAEVPAAGRQVAILTVARFGRYSVRAASRQGTAVRVVDRMAGELGAAGEAGHENGRLDLFLDRGDYQVVAESHERGEGTAKLSVEPFRDARKASLAQPAGAPQLVERKLLQESLDDLCQLSYWLQLDERREVRLEAAGRNLADVRLWQDGSWLEDVQPSCAAIQPVTGRPLLRCEIAATLAAGLHLVTAYGGAPQPWSEDAAEHPLYLRWGYPRLADAGRKRYAISPFGEDRFELPDNVNYVRIELPEARPAQLTAGWAGPGQLLSALAGAGAADSAEVKKNSVPPVAAVRVPPKPAAPSAGDRDEARERRRPRGKEGPGRRAEPTIGGEEGEPASGEGTAGGESGAEALSNAGAAALPGGAAAADAADQDQAAAEGAPGAMPEDSAGREPAPPATTAGGEEMAGAAASEQETGAPAEVKPPREEEMPAGESATGGESAAGEAGEGSEGGEGGEGAAAEGSGEGRAVLWAEGPRLWAAVRGTPGQAYVMQHFEQKSVYTFHVSGRYWISTIHSGDPRDSVDATAVLTSRPDSSDREHLERSAAVPIDGQHAWARRCNLLGPLELFLEVGEKGTYEVVSAGGGRFRIEPFLTSRADNYKPPDFARSGARWALDPGLYMLTAVPLRRGGIVTMGVRPVGKFGDLLREAAAPGAGRDPVRASVRLVPTRLDSDHRYTLYVNRQPGVEAGVVLRPWPVDLADPLPVTQRPGEPLALNFTVASAGTLRAETEDGQLLEAVVDGGPAQAANAVAPGDHLVEVRNPAGAAAARTISYSLWVEPLALAAAAPLPPLPAAALAALPRFPVLRPGSPSFIDLPRGASATFLVQADKPALYQLQTTGVLATAATLRTRTVVSLAAGTANGVGRNALVRQYLREGDFQATVSAAGRSQGHLGVELQSTPLRDGGELRLDAPARLTLAAGQAVVYRFTIAEAGDYRLLAMGLGFVYACRLEDADGWPIAPPNLPADVSRRLAPGSYRLVLLPQPVAGRAVTLLTRQREALRFAGHGPHALPLDTTVEHLWREPDGGPDGAPAAERPPDLWRFELPAAATATLTLDAEMQGTLTRLDGGAEGGGAAAGVAGAPVSVAAGPAAGMLGEVPPGRSLALDLAAGRYQLAVVCSRRNSLVRYRVRVATAELVAGEEPLLTAPTTLAVSVGGAGLVEISSYSARDVRARLYAPDGRLVADEDDRPDDWNFLISERLPAGRYRLEIEPVGRRTARLRLAMRTVAEVEGGALALPYRGDVELAGEVRLLPLSLPPRADLLLVAARSQENLGLGLEVREGEVWRLAGSSTGREPRLELPLPPAPPLPPAVGADGGAGPGAASGAGAGAGAGTRAYRLRLWSLERRGGPVQLAAAAIAAPRLGERELARGAAVPLVAGVEPPLAPLAAAVVELAHPGLVRLQLDGGQAERASRSRRTRGGETESARAGAGAGGSAEAATGGEAAAGWRGGSVGGQVLAPLAGVDGVVLGGLAGTGGRIWLVAEAPHGAPRVRGARLALPPGLDRAVGFHLPAPGAMVSCDVDRGKRTGPVLAMVTALAGQPAVQVADAPAAPGTPPAAAMAIGPRSAVSVALSPRQPAARVWDGEPAALQGQPPEVRLAQLSYAAPGRETAAWGVTGGTLVGQEARQFELPPGAKRIRLSLGAAMVAVLSDGDAAASTHWQGGLPFEELLDGGASRLTLLHTGGGADPFTFELLPRAAGEGELALASATPFVRSFDRAGTLRLRLPGPADAPGAAGGGAAGGGGTRRYRVWQELPGGPGGQGDAGGAAMAALLDGAGGVRRGDDLAGAPGGFLLVQHGPGVVAVWAAGLFEAATATAAGGAGGGPGDDLGGGPGGGSWQAPLAAPAQAVTLPATVALAGRFAHLAIASREPAVLHVRAATPALTLLAGAGAGGGGGGAAAIPAGAGGGGGETVAIHPGGVRLDAYLLPGVSHLGFGALGEGELGGFVELTTTPVTPMRNGLGPEILLPAGGTRYFSFHVASRRPVGWAAAAGAERVSCRLLSAGGRAVEPRAPADMLQMADLDAGDYLLVLSAPPDAAPLRVRPVVVGLELPDTGPPPEVIRHYLQEAGAAVPAADAAPGSHP